MEGESGTTGGRRKTAWMTHVKATMRAHKGLKLKQVLKLAKKTYKKTAKRGGGVAGGLSPMTVGGETQSAGRRRGRSGRRHGKTRRH